MLLFLYFINYYVNSLHIQEKRLFIFCNDFRWKIPDLFTFPYGTKTNRVSYDDFSVKRGLTRRLSHVSVSLRVFQKNYRKTFQ